MEKISPIIARCIRKAEEAKELTDKLPNTSNKRKNKKSGYKKIDCYEYSIKNSSRKMPHV